MDMRDVIWAAAIFSSVCVSPSYAGESVVETPREIPLLCDVDVLVVGGTVGAVAAASAAAEAGATVYLAGGFPYLGEDMAATLELGLDGAESPSSELTRKFWHLRSGLAPYSYKAKMDKSGPWTYKNDFEFKLAESSEPRTARDTMRHTTDTSVECALARASDVSHIDAIVFDVKDGRTSGVVAEILDGKLKGLKCELKPVRDLAVDGDYKAGKAKARVFSAEIGDVFQRVRLDFAKDPAAECQYISRIHFRLADPGAFMEPPTPMKVKRDLDEVLLNHKIPFITSSPLSDLLVDENGLPAGGVVANRSGRQAVRAKAVIDATLNGAVTRLAKSTGISGEVVFTRVVNSEKRPVSSAVEVEPLDASRGLWRLSYRLPVISESPRDILKVASESDRLTWTNELRDQADIACPEGVRPPPPRTFVLRVPSDCPVEDRIAAGIAVGCEAAKESRLRHALKGVHVEALSTEASPIGEVRELLGGFRAWEGRRNETVPSLARSLPVFAETDVVVVGLGTSGAAAAIGVARGGMRVIGIEFAFVPGGVGTEGLIAGYYDGNHCGFTAEFNRRCVASGMKLAVNRRIVAWRGLMAEAGVEAWYGCMGEGAWTDSDGRVRGVVVVTPYGRGVVLARTVIDATGNSDIAAAAGAKTVFGGLREFALQSAGQAPLRLGRGGANSDFGYVNDSDAFDLWLFSLKARQGALDAWDMSQIIDSRERRRIVPDYAMQGWDVDARRPFPDTIVQPRSRHDSHGYLVDDYWYVQESKDPKSPRDLNVPLRSVLPQGISNLSVVGLGAGVARDVMPMVRMQADLMNMGYAVGLAAAQAVATTDGDYRKIDLQKLRKRLVADGILRDEVLDWNDDPEPSDEALAAAAATLGNNYRGAGVLWRAPERAKPFVLRAYADAKDPMARLAYAKTLGLWGDGTGSHDLVLAFKRTPRDVGIAKALGRGHSLEARSALLAALESINASSDLDAVRAVCNGLEELGDFAAAESLSEKLKMPGICGHDCPTVESVPPMGGYGVPSDVDRALVELSFARALLACGDWDGVGRAVYERYSRDVRGFLSEHAYRILKRLQKKQSPRWISGDTSAPEKPAPVLVKRFELAEVPAKAELTLAVAGWHELFVNGKRIGDEVLSPTTCQPNIRISSITRDVTSSLKRGENEVAVLLGNGWFNCFTKTAWGFPDAPWIAAPMICGGLVADGVAVFSTDESWCAYDSPIVFNALRNGEWYDARKEGCRENVRAAKVEKYTPYAEVSPEDAPPCREFDPLAPVRSFPAGDGGTIYDFGSNRTGWCEIDVLGEPGAKVTLDYDETLTRTNTFLGEVTRFVRRENDPRPAQHDEYTLAGRVGGERWHPRFTYHGFRYVRVRTEGKVELKGIRSVFVHSDFMPVGMLEISDPLFAKLHDATRRSYLSNFTGIPTDCPHREKNGWTGDAQLAMETGLWNFDAKAGYVHFLRMMLDAQKPNGQVPCILPCTEKFGYKWGSGPAWDAALFELPWQIHRFYGDDAMARESYVAMKKYLSFIGGKARRDGLVEYGLGDWCAPESAAKAPVLLTDSAYVYEFNQRVAFWADRFGEDAVAVECRARAAEIKTAFNKEFYKGNGVYAGGELTSLAAPLYFRGLCADGEEKKVVSELVRRVREDGHRANFGILGAKWIPRVLSDGGYIDDAWRIFTQPNAPGWAVWMKNNDTLLESFDEKSWAASHNHIMFGDLSAWAYEYAVGIVPVEPGFRKVAFRPHYLKGVDSFSATYRTPHGVIRAGWRRVDGKPVFDYSVPDGVEVVGE